MPRFFERHWARVSSESPVITGTCSAVSKSFNNTSGIAYPLSLPIAYAGMAKVRLDRESIGFAIEYERTLKSQPKYEKIRKAIESEKRLHAFFISCRHSSCFGLWPTNFIVPAAWSSLRMWMTSSGKCSTCKCGRRVTAPRHSKRRY